VYFPQNIIWLTKYRSIKWVGHVARKWKRKVDTMFWRGNPGKETFGRPKRTWEGNIKINLQEVVWGHGLH
jgi:hypothetical protein